MKKLFCSRLLKTRMLDKSVNHALALMSEKEKEWLYQISASIPTGGVVVEIGTFLGGSASIIAHANPNVIIHSFDLYNNRHDRHKPEVQDRLNSILGKYRPRNIDAVKKIVSVYTNIQLHKGTSPDCAKDWTTPIDLYFEDGTHVNPKLQENIDHWSTFIKPNGYLLLHDHRPNLPIDDPSRFLSVEESVSHLLNNGYKELQQVEGLILLQKFKEPKTV